MTNPRDYPDTIQSAESGRPLRRGVKRLTINVDGQPFTYGQPGWWAAIDDPADTEGQLTDEDNVIRCRGTAGSQGQGKARGSLAAGDPGHPRGVRTVATGGGARVRWRPQGVREIREPAKWLPVRR